MTAVASAQDRYLDLIAATLRHALANRQIQTGRARLLHSRTSVGGEAFGSAGASPSRPAEAGDPLPIESVLPAIAGEFDSARALGRIDLGKAFDFVDGAGHRRPAYRGLAMRALLRASSDAAQTRAFVDRVGPAIRAFNAGEIPLDAAHASDVLAVIFDAGAIESATHASAADRAIAERTFDRLTAGQQVDGTFLARSASDNPEPLWYAELALLHAVNVHAIERDDDSARAAAGRAARYLAAEVQPDHASSHPWAIAALLEEPDGVALADTMLHVAGVQEPATMDAVSLLLLADALRSSGRMRMIGRMSSANAPTPTDSAGSPISPNLLKILRCPLTRSPLKLEGETLVAERGGLRYPIRNGIPVLLVEEAELPEGVASLDDLKKQLGL